MKEITVEVWGDFACFSPPYAKVERLTYPFPTPSAARGILSAIYSKPKEFYWQIKRIEVLNPIHYIENQMDQGFRYISFKRNEVKSKTSTSYLIADEDRTQRQTVALKDVRYRITAIPVLQPGFDGTEEQIYEQAMRRIAQGKCFYQPCLGMKEFVAYFAPCSGPAETIQDSMDAGLMVYDVFDLHDNSVKAKTTPKLSLFHAVMEHGVIEVPPYDSPDVLKGG